MTDRQIPRPYALARMAECSAPDTEESAGARFLTNLAEHLADVVDGRDLDADDIADAVSETADQAPDIYTATLWREFVDLGAWAEDPTDLGADGSDMEQAARICLYIIAERLAWALLEEWKTDAAEADADAEVDA